MDTSCCVDNFYVTVRPDARSISFENVEGQIRQVFLDGKRLQLSFFEQDTVINKALASVNPQNGKVGSTINVRRIVKVDVKSAFRKTGEIVYAIVLMCDCTWTWLRHSNRDVVFSWADRINRLSRIVTSQVNSDSPKLLNSMKSSFTSSADNLSHADETIMQSSNRPSGDESSRDRDTHVDANSGDMFTTQMRTVRHAGYASKEGYKVRSWKRRFFVLDNVALYYFTGHEAVTREGMKGCINLSDVRLVDEASASRAIINSFKPNLFQIVTSKRTYFMQTDSVDAKNEWIKQLRTAIEQLHAGTQSSHTVDTNPLTFTNTNALELQQVASPSSNARLNSTGINARNPNCTLPSVSAQNLELDGNDFQRRTNSRANKQPVHQHRRSSSDQSGRLHTDEAERLFLRVQTARVQQRLALIVTTSPSSDADSVSSVAASASGQVDLQHASRSRAKTPADQRVGQPFLHASYRQ